MDEWHRAHAHKAAAADRVASERRLTDRLVDEIQANALVLDPVVIPGSPTYQSVQALQVRIEVWETMRSQLALLSDDAAKMALMSAYYGSVRELLQLCDLWARRANVDPEQWKRQIRNASHNARALGDDVAHAYGDSNARQWAALRIEQQGREPGQHVPLLPGR